jgi:SAM-dependent methyltransferase
MTTTAAHEALRALWISEYNRPFEGWDFSYLAGRRSVINSQNTWDYVDHVLAAVDGARAMLDMDTGGGEMLAGLSRRPPLVSATEGYAPNVPVARARLAPLGVDLVEVRDVAHLPFADGQFDLITNRHGSYEPREVWRVLAPGGLFITQQVGSQTNRRLHDLLAHPAPASTWSVATAESALRAVGFHILEQHEDFPITRYTDVGAIVYYLKAIAWEVPDFSVDRYFDKLIDLHTLIQAEGPLDVAFHIFFIKARRER